MRRRRLSQMSTSSSAATLGRGRVVPQPRARSPSGVPVAKALAAPTYSGSRLRWPTSIASSPRGSNPPPISVSRAAARATTPFGPSKAFSASSSPCTTAACTSTGTPVPPVTSADSASSRAADSGLTGRPSHASGTTSRRGQHVQPGQHLRGAPWPRAGAAPSSAAVTRSAPCTTGSVTMPARTSSRSNPCLSSAALATATAAPTSAATGPPERRSARWRMRGVDGRARARRTPGRRRRDQAAERVGQAMHRQTVSCPTGNNAHEGPALHRRHSAQKTRKLSHPPTSLHARAGPHRGAITDERDLGEPAQRDTAVPAAGRARRRRQRDRRGLCRGRRRPARLLGATRPAG